LEGQLLHIMISHANEKQKQAGPLQWNHV